MSVEFPRKLSQETTYGTHWAGEGENPQAQLENALVVGYQTGHSLHARENKLHYINTEGVYMYWQRHENTRFCCLTVKHMY